MATHLEIPVQTRIANGGGENTSIDKLGDGSTTWGLGQLVKITSGTVTVLQAGAGQLDASADLATATKLALGDAAVAVATADEVDIVRILKDTTFIGVMCSSLDGAIPAGVVGTQYTLYQTAAGDFAPNQNVVTDPVCEIVRIGASSQPFVSSEMPVDSNGDLMNYVEWKFLESVIDEL